jgi:hypothetical protein
MHDICCTTSRCPAPLRTALMRECPIGEPCTRRERRVAELGKRVENRTWRLPCGYLWIHAGSRSGWDPAGPRHPALAAAWHQRHGGAPVDPDAGLIRFSAVVALIRVTVPTTQPTAPVPPSGPAVRGPPTARSTTSSSSPPSCPSPCPPTAAGACGCSRPPPSPPAASSSPPGCPSYPGQMSAPDKSRSIRVMARIGGTGDTWLGVGVCLHCQPDEEVRRTFSAGEACPQCGTPGTLEWRYWPELLLSPTQSAPGTP